MRRLIYLFLIGCCTLSVAAQDMKSVFLAMPDSLTPLLTKVNKEDFVDFLESNMKAEVKNRLDQSAEMKVLSADYLQLQMTKNSQLEMKLLPVNDSVKVVCLVKTVCASACDSEIRFYSTDWKTEFVREDYLSMPKAEAFYLPKDTWTEEEALIKKVADMNLMKASLSKEDVFLTFVYTTPEYLNKEDKEKLLPYLKKEPLVFRWSEGKFR